MNLDTGKCAYYKLEKLNVKFFPSTDIWAKHGKS